MKLFKRLNYIFLHDEDEAAPISDYIWFYGFNGGSLLVSLILLAKILGG